MKISYVLLDITLFIDNVQMIIKQQIIGNQ